MIPPLSEAIERFLKVKKAGGKAQKTLVWYKRILGLMAKELGADKPLSDITQDSLIDYLAGLRDNHRADGADSYTRAVKAFWSWASVRYGVPDPTREVKYPKVRASKAMAMTEENFKKLFANAGFREQAVLAFLLATGARASEILQLRVSKIDWVHRRQMVTGKGEKTRFLHWDTLTSEILAKWLEARPHEHDAVFTSEQGTPLTYNGLYLALKRLALKVGLEGRFNPHSIRHLFGKVKTASGENAILLAKLMGHSDVNLTAKTYSQFEAVELSTLDDKTSTVKKILE